jgi:hypothetical protein
VLSAKGSQPKGAGQREAAKGEAVKGTLKAKRRTWLLSSRWLEDLKIDIMPLGAGVSHRYKPAGLARAPHGPDAAAHLFAAETE